MNVAGDGAGHLPEPDGRDAFVAAAGVVPDGFQRRAMDALDRGSSVLVAAPTGSGKTLVAEYAVARALARGGKAFYTTPLKALSNQKFGDFVRRYGEDRVGLLTGDVSVRGDAPVVVMTTEVLRNMLFARSGALDGLACVVLDEVHYLQDPYRGPVWEEVLVVTPPGVAFVCLSATVHNSQDFGAWLRSVRGSTEVVVETERPVELQHHFALAERGRDDVTLLPLLVDGRPNPRGARIDDRARRRRSGPRPFRVPRRTEMVEHLHGAGMLPAITFIFSRAACDDAVRQCVGDGVVLTTPAERHRVRAVIEDATDGLDDDDLAALGYGPWAHALECGLASHHAGLVPAFRHAAERCFSAGLARMVFATETLALGINMPARTVVIERFAKFRGAERTPLTSGEYRQLTGRAGRRGIDPVGHAVVLWSPATTFATVAAVALAPPPDLSSSFHPTYNLAVNLVRRWTRDDAHRLLASSYGQWQAPGGSVSLPAQLDRRLAVLSAHGHVDGWTLTADGERLARIYHESDLLVADALGAGVLDGLDPAVLAGVVSALTFEARSIEEGPRPPREGRAAERLDALAAMAAALRAEERGLRAAADPPPRSVAGPHRHRLGAGRHPVGGVAPVRHRRRRLRAQHPPARRPAPPGRPGGARPPHGRGRPHRRGPAAAGGGGRRRPRPGRRGGIRDPSAGTVLV